MNIIELVKQILTDCPLVSDLSGSINIDYTEDKPVSFGLYPTGDQLLREDILGNQDRQHNFVLYAVFQSFTDYDRLANSTFLLDLAYYLEKVETGQEIEVTINNKTVTGKLTKLSSANGMLYGYNNETLSGPVTYQIQIQAQYRIESEGF
ncbi:hypothetical protein DFR55_10980 [Herbinix hemicellulosilytica]|uniref:Minor capsid protein n=1 Tax=Herbinix hemicellulosilytica TaxID=1564487 RepID=A0A0H5SX52_HERHM|nr:hypothetical protein [Herbinix hemicellulosilytica]RBP58865.1 hypothetical protein DFR55_10980 [Herbinix hemicellulosilytica]CRZ34928.1 hypothetical protein HHT355_1728 [Herbinix hemicellulosilytica]